MFNELKQLLRKGDQVILTIAIEDDTQLRVNVFPKLFTLDGENGDNRKALNTPLTITATPDELDSPAFIETLTKLSASTTALRNTLEEVEAQHKAAAEAAKVASAARTKPGAKATDAKPAKAAPVASAKEDKPKPAPADDDNTEDLLAMV